MLLYHNLSCISTELVFYLFVVAWWLIKSFHFCKGLHALHETSARDSAADQRLMTSCLIYTVCAHLHSTELDAMPCSAFIVQNPVSPGHILTKLHLL